MDSHVKEYYRQFSDEVPGGAFHKVVGLHDAPDSSWYELSRMAPDLPRGWFELSEMTPKDRIDFIRDFWLSKLPFYPHIIERLDPFFGGSMTWGSLLRRKNMTIPGKRRWCTASKATAVFLG